MTNMQILAMDRAGETGEVIFRTHCSLGSGGGASKPLTNKQIEAALEAWFSTIYTGHEPAFHQRMRAAIAAATEGDNSHE